VMVVGVELGSVVRSADGGKTWQDHRKGALAGNGKIDFSGDGGLATEADWRANIDLNLGNDDRVSAKFFFSNSDQNVPFSGASVPGFPALRDFDNRNLAIAHTHLFSSKAVNQFRAGFSRIAGRSTAPSPLTAQSVGITRANDQTVRSLPHIQILGALQLGNATNDKNETTNNNLYVSDTVSVSRGRHNLRFGAEIFRNQFVNGPDNTVGTLLFLSFLQFGILVRRQPIDLVLLLVPSQIQRQVSSRASDQTPYPSHAVTLLPLSRKACLQALLSGSSPP